MHTANLVSHAGSHSRPGGIVGGAVDAQTGRESLNIFIKQSLSVVKLAVSESRGRVTLKSERVHFNSPNVF